MTVPMEDGWHLVLRNDCDQPSQCGGSGADGGKLQIRGADGDREAYAQQASGTPPNFSYDIYDVQIKATWAGTTSDLDGTWNGGVTAGVAGISGTAYDFDGSGDYVELGSSLIAGTGDFTISAWINPCLLYSSQSPRD